MLSSVKKVTPPDEDENTDPRLKSCDPELIERIEMEIIDNGDPVTFDDIGIRSCFSSLFDGRAIAEETNLACTFSWTAICEEVRERAGHLADAATRYLHWTSISPER